MTFVKTAAAKPLPDIVETHETRKLSNRDRDVFLALLDNPPAPNDALRSAAAAFKRAVQSGALLPTQIRGD